MRGTSSRGDSASPRSLDPREHEALAEALHALLFAHPNGLGLADIAGELRLERAVAEALLDAEQRQWFVDMVLDDDGGRYVTMRKVKPARPAAQALEAHRMASQDRAKVRRYWRIGLGAVAILVSASALAWRQSRRSDGATPPVTTHVPSELAQSAAGPGVTSRPTEEATAATEPSPSPSPMPPSPRTRVAETSREPTSMREDFARAAGAREDLAEWQQESRDLEQRIATLRANVTSSGCASRWDAGDRCYVSHRLMSRTDVDEELARMELRRASLRRVIDVAR